MAYTGSLRPKGRPFPRFRYTKGWIFLVEVYKRVGKSAFASVCQKTLKRLIEEFVKFVAVKKSRTFPGFVMQRSKLGVPLLNGRYMKRVVQVPLLSKIIYKRVTPGWTSKRSLPV